MSSNTSNISNSKKDTKTKDKTTQNIVNYGTIIVIIIIIYLIYKYFIERKYIRIRGEGFENFKSFNTSQNTTAFKNTIYEKSIINIFGDNIRLKCSMIPTLSTNNDICRINNEPFVPYLFPIHMIKLIDGAILAVFNDGRLYKKDNILSTMWAGPITNSKPQNIIPLRMITLKTDLVTLLAIGYDNILYMKKPDNSGNIDLKGEWTQVPNNSNIIYVLFDNDTDLVIAVGSL